MEDAINLLLSAIGYFLNLNIGCSRANILGNSLEILVSEGIISAKLVSTELIPKCWISLGLKSTRMSQRQSS